MVVVCNNIEMVIIVVKMINGVVDMVVWGG